MDKLLNMEFVKSTKRQPHHLIHKCLLGIL